MEQLNRILISENKELKVINKKIIEDSNKIKLQLEDKINNLNTTINNYKRFFPLIDKFKNTIIYKFLKKVKYGKKH